MPELTGATNARATPERCPHACYHVVHTLRTARLATMPKDQFTILRCHLPEVQAVYARSRHVFGKHMHDQFGIGVIHEGAQKSLSGRGVVQAVCGDVISVNPGEVHDGAPIGDAARAWRMLYFNPSQIADFTRDMTEGRASALEFSRPVIQSAQSAQHFLSLFRRLTASESEASMRNDELLFLLLAQLLQVSAPHATATASILNAKRRLDDDPSAAATLTDLALDCGMSRFQLLREFARATGLTPHAYLLQRRLHLARRLIRQGLTLADTAASSGFSDQSHMTRLFVRQYGVSPHAYGRAVR